jgi:hypothetical protein
MISLVLTYCLATGAQCHDERPLLPEQEASLTVMSCAVAGQQIGAEWVAEHPGWLLQQYRCEIDRPKTRDT